MSIQSQAGAARAASPGSRIAKMVLVACRLGRHPPGAVHPGQAGGLWLLKTFVPSGLRAVVVPSGFRVTVQPHR
jgi:hypothetical protein